MLGELVEDVGRIYAYLFAQTLLKDFAHHNKGFSNFCEKYRLDFKTYSQFDGIAIEERQKLLFELVKLIWA